MTQRCAQSGGSRLNNILVLVMSLVSCLVVPISYSFARASPHANWLLLLLLQAPLYLFSFAFAYGRMAYLATLWFGGVAAVALVVQAHLLGRDSGMHYYLLLHAVGPFVLVPPRYHRWVFVQSALYLAVFAYALFGIEPQPLLPMPAGALDEMGKVNLVFVFFSLIAFGYYERTNTLHAEAMVEAERQRAETLLLNILPAEIALRLKHDQSSIADGFADVTVMFADIAGLRAPARITRSLAAKKERRVDSQSRELATHSASKWATDKIDLILPVPLPRWPTS